MSRPVSTTLARVLRQRRWSPEEAQIVLDALAASGRAPADFARDHQLQAQRIHAWRRRAVPPRSELPQTFVEVPASAPASPAVPVRYEIQLPTGEILRIDGAVDATGIGTLLALLRSGRAC